MLNSHFPGRLSYLLKRSVRCARHLHVVSSSIELSLRHYHSTLSLLSPMLLIKSLSSPISIANPPPPSVRLDSLGLKRVLSQTWSQCQRSVWRRDGVLNVWFCLVSRRWGCHGGEPLVTSNGLSFLLSDISLSLYIYPLIHGKIYLPFCKIFVSCQIPLVFITCTI